MGPIFCRNAGRRADLPEGRCPSAWRIVDELRTDRPAARDGGRAKQTLVALNRFCL
jgi:hypothetical protein